MPWTPLSVGAQMQPGIGDTVEPASVQYNGPGVKGTQIEAIVIEDRLRRGVGCEQDLEPSIEAEAFNQIGADAAADAVRGFQQQAIPAAFHQAPGAAQPGESCAENDHFAIWGHCS